MELIEQFKELHKEAEQLKDSGMSAGEIKRVGFSSFFKQLTSQYIFFFSENFFSLYHNKIHPVTN